MKKVQLFAALVIGISSCRAAAAEPSREAGTPPSPTASGRAAAASIEAARAHFARGVQFYNNGDYKLALVEFRRSHDLSHNYRVLYNIGQVNHQLGNYVKALAALEAYLRQGTGEIPEARQSEVGSSIAELRKKTAQIRLTLAVENTEVIIDDASIGSVRGVRALTVDAGEHRLEARKPGYVPLVKHVTLAAGDKAEIKLRLVKLPLSPAADSGSANRPHTTSPLIYAGWTATGAFAIAAAVTGVLATSNAKHLAEQRESPDSTADDREASAKRAQTFAIATDVLAGAALVTGVSSLYFSLRDGSGTDERPSKPTTQVGFNRLGLSLSHRF